MIGSSFRCLASLSIGMSLCILSTIASAAPTKPLTYGGRLVMADGSPVEGPLELSASFYTAATSGTLLGTSAVVSGVQLVDGVFAADFGLEDDDLHDVFADPSQPVWIEITDQRSPGPTHASDSASFPMP